MKTNQDVREFLVGPDRHLAACIADRVTGKERIEHPDGVFILIGMNPNSEAFKGTLEMDDWGFIKTDETLNVDSRRVRGGCGRAAPNCRRRRRGRHRRADDAAVYCSLVRV